VGIYYCAISLTLPEFYISRQSFPKLTLRVLKAGTNIYDELFLARWFLFVLATPLQHEPHPGGGIPSPLSP